MNGGFLINNKIKEAESIVANNTASGYDVENLRNAVVSEVWRGTSAVSTTTIDITLPDPIDFTAFGVINYSEEFWSSGLIELRLSTTGFSIFEQTIYLDTRLNERYVYKKNEAGVLLKTFSGNLYANFIPLHSYKYIQLAIGTTPSVAMQIGSLFIGDTFQFPVDFNQDYGYNFNVGKKIDNSNGQNYVEQLFEYQSFDLAFTLVPQIYYDDYKHLFREGTNIFVPNFDFKPCFFGIIPNESLNATRSLANEGELKDSFSFSFRENF
jgi:hypothetical protein